MSGHQRALAGFLILTLALTWPLAASLGTRLPSDAGDPVLNTWILWWNGQALPLSHAWWQAPAFYPATGVLAFSEHLLGLAWIAVPIEWLSGNPVLAYDVVFLLTFALSGWAAYLLAFELTGRRDAAWAGGALYAFCAYRIDQLPHLQVLASFGMPLALYALHRYGREGRARWLWLFGAAFVQQALTNGYFLLFFPVLLALWAIWFLPSWDGRRVRTLALAAAVAAAALAPVLWGYHVVHQAYGFSRVNNGQAVFGADVTSIVSAPVRLKLWSFLHASSRDEGRLFPGVTAIVLVAVALVRDQVRLTRPPEPWQRRKPDPTTRPLRLIRRLLLAGAAMYGLALAIRLVTGPIELGSGALTLTIVRMDKLASAVCYFGGAWCLLSPAVLHAWRRAAPLPFYALAAAAMWIGALGPNPTFLESPAISGAPYRWLLLLPGYEGLRVSGRFWMLGALCLATAGALAFARLVAAGAPRRSPAWALAAIVTAGALAESWVGAMPLVPPPPRSPLLEADARHPVIELPMGTAEDIAAMYRGIFHGEPVANGYSGYEPPDYATIRTGIADRDPAVLARLAALGVRDVRIDRHTDEYGSLERFVAAYPGVERVAESADEVLYRLPGT